MYLTPAAAAASMSLSELEAGATVPMVMIRRLDRPLRWRVGRAGRSRLF